MTPKATRIARVGGSLVVLTVVILLLPRGELTAALRQASPALLAGAVLGFVLCHVGAALKWRLLMGPACDLTVAAAIRAHFTGLVGNLSPLGMIGGDLVRAGVAIRGSSHAGSIMLSSVTDRLVDTAALMLLALTGFLWIGGRGPTAAIVLWGGFAVSAAGIGVLLVGHAILKRTHNVKLASVRDAFTQLRQHPGLVARALLLSVLIQGTLITINAWIGSSVGVDASYAAWLLAWPAAKFAAYVPIGVAGIGVRETALVALMRPFGGAAGPVLASGLLWDAVLILGSLGGWTLLTVLPTPAPSVAAGPVSKP